MNNEPVAWMYNYENFPDSFVVCRARKSDQDIPLYIHPVSQYKAITNTKIEPTVVSYTHPVKELTNEEIKSVYGEYFDVENCDWLHLQCIQAILRKAEK